MCGGGLGEKRKGKLWLGYIACGKDKLKKKKGLSKMFPCKETMESWSPAKHPSHTKFLINYNSVIH